MKLIPINQPAANAIGFDERDDGKLIAYTVNAVGEEKVVDVHPDLPSFLRAAAFNPAWVFKLFPRDASLVLRALGGRLTEDDLPKAQALCDKLTLDRAAAVKDFARTYEIAAEHVRAKAVKP